MTADPVFAHHLAQFNGRFVLARIGGIESSDDGPPARPHYSAHDGRAPCAIDCQTHANNMAQSADMGYIAPNPQSIRQCEISGRDISSLLPSSSREYQSSAPVFGGLKPDLRTSRSLGARPTRASAPSPVAPAKRKRQAPAPNSRSRPAGTGFMKIHEFTTWVGRVNSLIEIQLAISGYPEFNMVGIRCGGLSSIDSNVARRSLSCF